AHGLRKWRYSADPSQYRAREKRIGHRAVLGLLHGVGQTSALARHRTARLRSFPGNVRVGGGRTTEAIYVAPVSARTVRARIGRCGVATGHRTCRADRGGLEPWARFRPRETVGRGWIT